MRITLFGPLIDVVQLYLYRATLSGSPVLLTLFSGGEKSLQNRIGPMSSLIKFIARLGGLHIAGDFDASRKCEGSTKSRSKGHDVEKRD
jgi:hypothetical protein